MSTESSQCGADSCVWARRAFRLLEWRAARGQVAPWRAHTHTHNASDALPLLLLAPDAEVELKLSFAPREPAPLTAYLYLRYRHLAC